MSIFNFDLAGIFFTGSLLELMLRGSLIRRDEPRTRT